MFFKQQNEGKDEVLKQVQDDNKTVAGNQVVEFKKIDPTKYRVVIHSASGKFPLVFSESFHDGWKIYPTQSFLKGTFRKDTNGLDSYKILDGNADDQASGGELQDYINKGWITSLGDGKNKEIDHQKWEGNKEKLDYTEKYNIDFVSKNFQGTIQNDNLSSGHFWETWLQKPIENNANHLLVNGYANSWVIDVDKICSENPNSCIKNPPCEIGQDKSCISLGKDGTYDIEFVVEFWPQRLFYVGLFISISTLVACLGYLIYDWRKKRKPEVAGPKD